MWCVLEDGCSLVDERGSKHGQDGQSQPPRYLSFGGGAYVPFISIILSNFSNSIQIMSASSRASNLLVIMHALSLM